MVNKSVWKAVLGCNLKTDRMISVRFQGKPFNITVIEAYASTSNTEEAEVEWFCEDLLDLLELTPPKYVLFILGDWSKSRKSRNTWSNRQIWLCSTEWSRTKANRVLPRELIGHSKHPLPTTKEKTLHIDITRWSTAKSDWFSQETSVFPQLGGLSFKISFLKSIKSLNTNKIYVPTTETTQMEKFTPHLLIFSWELVVCELFQYS